jgi:uncharacterized lipoprotein YddW (UPF0748 family)
MNVTLLSRRPAGTSFVLLAILCVCAGAGCHPGWRRWGLEGPYGRKEIRAIWVTRWDYKTPTEIAAVMENSKSAGFNTVYFQVRGAGTAFYRSRIEPWAEELGGRDPGFDPLAIACREGHRRGVKVHAWVNVMPGWHGDKPPRNPKQLYHAHPDWFWYDAQGRRQPLGWYCSLNPCNPTVRKYLTAVMREIVAEYPVDGLHLDYIRFPNEWNDSYNNIGHVPDYPRDRRTQAAFRRQTGATPESDPQKWNDWRTEQVTQLVRDIRKMMLRVRPKAVLTAAVGAVPEESRRNHFQDSRRWIVEGLVDGLCPMNYASEMGTFAQRLTIWSRYSDDVAVIPGVMFDKRPPATVLEQVRRARRSSGHFAAFAYNSLFERRDGSGRAATDGQSASRAALRRAVVPAVRGLASFR